MTSPTNCNQVGDVSIIEEYIDINDSPSNYVQILSLKYENSKMNVTLSNGEKGYIRTVDNPFVYVFNKNPTPGNPGGEYFYIWDLSKDRNNMFINNWKRNKESGIRFYLKNPHSGNQFFTSVAGGRRRKSKKVNNSKKHVRRSRLRSRTHKRTLRSRS